MKLLVTGGAGFLGSHLCTALLEQGHEVIALDNLYTGSFHNIEHLKSATNFSFVEQDITNKLDFEVDGIFNLACAASPAHYQARPVETLKASVHGSINVLDLATQKNIRVLHSSTSEVYGDPKITPQVEEYWGNVNPIGIRSCYDEGKRAAETLFFDYHREYGTDIRIVRIFNTYGPRMAINDGRVVSNFIVQALRGEDLTVYGDGSQVRSLCYVSDLIDGIIKLYFADGLTGPINIGNPQPITMRDLAEEIIKQVGSNSKIIYKPLPSDDPLTREPDITKAKNLLGWSPKVNRSEGIAKTIEYFKTVI
jgi:UDP-glucuronate decarboxylase